MRRLLAAVMLAMSLPISAVAAAGPEGFLRCAALDLGSLFVGGPATAGFVVPNDTPRTIGIAVDTSGLSAEAAEKLVAAVRSAVVVWSVVPERFSFVTATVAQADIRFTTSNTAVSGGVSVRSVGDGQGSSAVQVGVDPVLLNGQEAVFQRQVRYGLGSALGLGKIAPNTYESVLAIDGDSTIVDPTPFDIQLLRQRYGAPLCSWAETQSAWNALAQEIKTIQAQASQLKSSQKTASGSSAAAAKRLAASRAKLAAAQRANVAAATKLSRICGARPKPKGC